MCIDTFIRNNSNMENKMSQFLNPPPYAQEIVITNDGGGYVSSYKEAAFRYYISGKKIKVAGSCRSACTLSLSYSNVCVFPNAIFKWHMAYDEDTGIRRPDVTNQMISAMPQRVADRLRGVVSRDYNPSATLTGYQLIELGIKACVKSYEPKNTNRSIMFND